MPKHHLLAIVGPTASGKTALSLQLAQQLGGEIICADSRTVYQCMDIGTAKPSKEDQKLIRHHLLDVVAPDRDFSVAQFKDLAKVAMERCWDRGHIPILVGGSGLYVDAFCYDFELRSGNDNRMSELSLRELQQKALKMGAELNHSDFHNPRRLKRVLETSSTQPSRRELPDGWQIVGLNPSPRAIEAAITSRTEKWINVGLKEEAAWLFERYGDIEPLNTSPYKEVKQLLAGEIDQTETERLINVHLRQLAKRQLTWFRRNLDIHWFSEPAKAAMYVQSLPLKAL